VFRLFPAASPDQNPFSTEELESIQGGPVPRHVACIMDGNRRWAKSRGKFAIQGHLAGVSALSEVVRAAAHLGVETLTVYGFSTENWRRAHTEVGALLRLIATCLDYYVSQMVKWGVRFRAIGNREGLPAWLVSRIEKVEERTAGGERISLVVALNYGGRDEILRASARFAEEVACGKIDRENLSENVFSQYLDTAEIGDPELLVRTSGESRLSNFLLWQLSYAEIYFTETLWPDFGSRELLCAVQEYQLRQRRLGG
jgi:undecaprenyl diphosphate synthase